jgi:hypothetical protein
MKMFSVRGFTHGRQCSGFDFLSQFLILGALGPFPAAQTANAKKREAPVQEAQQI